jgi:hypothetical protein
MNLAELAAEFVLREITSDDLPDRACRVLVAGYDSEHLAALAGAEKDTHPTDLRTLFVKGLADLGIELPVPLDAAEILKRRCARRVVEGTISPPDGAAYIVDLLGVIQPHLPRRGHFLGDTFGVAGLVGLHYALEEAPEHDAEARGRLEDGIVQACARIARGEDANDVSLAG